MGYALPTFPTSFTGTGGGSGACTVNNYISCDGDGGTGGTGDTKDPSGRVSSAGVIRYNFDLTSAVHVSTGIYKVVTVPSFDILSGEVQCAIKVTPEGQLQDPLTAEQFDFKGLSSIIFSQADINIFYSNTLGELYVNDSQHNTVTGLTYDRIAIFNPYTRSWNYIDFLGEDLIVNYQNKGSILMHDDVNETLYSVNNDVPDGHVGTLIFNMIGRFKIFDTWNDITHGQSFGYYILAINPLNDTCLIMGDSHSLRWYLTEAGVPTSQVAAATFPGSGYDTGNVQPVVDINNNYWIYKNNGGAAQFWVRTYLAAGPSIAFEEISIATDMFNNNPAATRINPTTNCFYYMSSNDDYLMKFDCTVKAASRVNSVAYPALTTPNRHLTLRNLTALRWSSDYSTLLGMRGGSNEGDFLVIDPVDGSILQGIEVADKYSRNVNAGRIAITDDRVWSVGSQVIQQINLAGGENLGTLSLNAVTFDAIWLSANECQIEFRSALTGARQDTGFHIAFASIGTAAGGGGGTGTGEDLHQFVVPFAFGDSTPSLIGQIAANKNILSVQVFVSQAFNGVGATLSVGPTALPTDLMTTLENNPAVVGEYSVYTVKSYGTATNLYLHIVPGAGASTGTGIVVIEYQP